MGASILVVRRRGAVGVSGSTAHRIRRTRSRRCGRAANSAERV